MAANNKSHLDGYLGKSYDVNGIVVYVQKVIAEGGYGIVFLAKNTSNFTEPGAKSWALKRVLVNNKDDLRNCQREIFVMQTNRKHPNIVRLEQSIITHQGGDIYEVLMLMEFCNSGNVLELMNQYFADNQKLPEKLILRIFYDVVKAVASLHQLQKPTIHRDLKVENVLLNGENYKLCDFGSCTRNIVTPSLENVHQIEEDLQRFTTMSYRSPEMVDLYSNKTIGPKSDIWALGVMLYKMCYFTLPFGESMVAIMEGNFKLPENSPYSQAMHTLICYLLTSDLDERPDIFQVAYVVSNMAQQPLTVQNKTNSPIPSRLPDPPPLGQKRHQQKTSLSAANAQTVTQTSLTPRQRPKASQGAPTAAAPAASEPARGERAVDVFGASHFGAPAGTNAAPTAAEAAAPSTVRHRRVPVGKTTKEHATARPVLSGKLSKESIDAFGAPAFGAPAAPSGHMPSNAASVPSVSRTASGGASAPPPAGAQAPPKRSDSPSASSMVSNDSFDPRRSDIVEAAHGPQRQASVDPFGAAVFAPSGAPSQTKDAFDSTPFGETQKSAVMPMAEDPAPVSSLPQVTPNDPFNMASFGGAVENAASTVPPPAVTAGPAQVDAFGAPVFQGARSNTIRHHRRVSSDVTAALFHSDVFAAEPFGPAANVTNPGYPAGQRLSLTTASSPAPLRNPAANVCSTVPPPSAAPASGLVPGPVSTAAPVAANDLMNFCGSSPAHAAVLGFGSPSMAGPFIQSRTAPSSPTPFDATAAPMSRISGTGSGADLSAWSVREQELLRQREKLEQQQRALLLQQQEVSRQQQQLALMQRQLAASSGGSGGQLNGQVLANPMAQMSNFPPVQQQPQQPPSPRTAANIKFAHASSLSPSGAILTSTALQQQQQMRSQGASTRYAARGPTGPALGDVFR